MNNKTRETTASISVQDFTRICKEVDREIREEFESVFAQKRTYEKAAGYADALANPFIPVKTSWALAEYSRYATPGPVQSLIGENKWDSGELWDRIGVKAGKSLGNRDHDDPLGPGLVTDETAQGKQGKSTAGVSHQYAGCAGGIINCVTWVALSLVMPDAKTWISSRLFLPEKTWFTGAGETGTRRREKAGVPEDVAFESKPKLARRQFRHARELGIKFNWAGGDEVYGRYAALRDDHEENGEAYAYFVPRNHVVMTLGKERRRVDELFELDHVKYETRTAGPGVNGPRYYDWAMIGVESPRHFLLIRKSAGEEKARQDDNRQESTAGRPGEAGRGTGREPDGNGTGKSTGDRVKDEGITFCLCYVPEDSPIRPTMPNLVLMAGRRWGVEETMSLAKGPVGWDENQFRKWESMHHHAVLAGLAMLKANIINERVDTFRASAGTADPHGEENREESMQEVPRDYPEPSAEDFFIPLGDAPVPYHAGQAIPEGIGFIRLSVNEVIRLKSIVLAGFSDAEIAFHIRWSKWRRKHQAVARWYHRIARLADSAADGESTDLRGVVTLCNWHSDSPLASGAAHHSRMVITGSLTVRSEL